ncbi:pyrimidine operon attenuation protein / uracil phosphoribosyltransferase [Cupriavidus sp. OV038]|jgi:pyrimidine operon attenuation protein/uracil phosphoribosyltransferase|uniref:bifunctional pyr operon transcriptional regulator/uracil phosphoribosyltransferase PyrR n=1 Tax=unclassified Cupriavidus TaxID=2640874 RepID=UPI0008ECCE0E|nr:MULTISPECIES: bifunctional pyr operon transcriptional regulator/uracil phosphoribosyltransferase PyrR [unclassified Cupriavidus]SFB79118.1 pyrimidine operon attenuation protein / uracil phosphoribosyltransferase [Cupriavidus sp. OV038]SFO65886.1 pyrimidine operon attenuation protein / uracil phosphoribosyltransferase [Cupriavidus sp. OV096]
MTQTSTPDAEALYHALRDQAQALMPAAERANWSVAGIYSGGAWIAERLAADLKLDSHGVINVAFHRDDYAKKGLHSQAEPTTLPFDVQDRNILLIDDVLATGRTIRAAVNELFDYGRPGRVALVVLADRGGRNLPIAADFAAATIELPQDKTLVLSRQGEGAATRFAFATEARA